MSSTPAKFQFSLALLKPDLCANPALIPLILNSLKNKNFKILGERRLLWNQSHAEKFYAEHRARNFLYHKLFAALLIKLFFFSSGPFVSLILSKPNAIREWRELIGPTHPFRARINSPNTLRALYGLTDTRNSFHGS
ncbi:6449_t:CDS:2, partial [Acaulospora morrowiae]